MSQLSPSSDLVTVTAHSKNKQLISQSLAEEWLATTSSGKDMFTSVLSDAEATMLVYAYHKGTPMSAIVTGVFGLVGTMAVDLVGFMPLLGGNNDWFTIAVGVGGFVVPFSIFMTASALMEKRYHRWGEKWWSVVHQVQTTGMRGWLKARYGILVEEDEAEFLALHTLQGNEQAFVDKVGRRWRIRPTVAETDSKEWIVEEDKTLVVPEAPTVEGPTGSVVALPGEAQTLYDSIVARVNMLDSYSLAVESSHTVRRAEQEAQQVVASYRKLESLEESGSGEGALIEVLAAVNEELLEVAQAEAASVHHQMAAQSNYLQEKKATKGSSALKLPAAQDELPTALKIEKKVVGN